MLVSAVIAIFVFGLASVSCNRSIARWQNRNDGSVVFSTLLALLALLLFFARERQEIMFVSSCEVRVYAYETTLQLLAAKEGETNGAERTKAQREEQARDAAIQWARRAGVMRPLSQVVKEQEALMRRNGLKSSLERKRQRAAYMAVDGWLEYRAQLRTKWVPPAEKPGVEIFVYATTLHVVGKEKRALRNAVIGWARGLGLLRPLAEVEAEAEASMHALGLRTSKERAKQKRDFVDSLVSSDYRSKIQMEYYFTPTPTLEGDYILVKLIQQPITSNPSPALEKQQQQQVPHFSRANSRPLTPVNE